MEKIWGPDRGEFVRAEGSTPFDGPDGPARTGRTLERPARLEEADMVEAVSRRPQGTRGGLFTRSPRSYHHDGDVAFGSRSRKAEIACDESAQTEGAIVCVGMADFDRSPVSAGDR